jgi:tetratricopeptide (TPR) repeat protein
LLLASTAFDDAFRAGLIALQRNDLTAAEQSLQTAARMAPENGRVWIALAEVYRKSGDGAKAAALAEKAARLAPKDHAVAQALATFYFSSAEPLLKAGKFGEAVSALEPARKNIGQNAQIELALGVAYYGLRRFDEAADAFLRTIAIAPETDQPYVFLGKVLDQVPARQAEATARFAQYEAAHPGSATGYLLHAQGLDAQGIEPEKARALIEKSLAIDGSNAAAHFEMGNLLDRFKQYEEAAREFERAAALNPSDAAAHYRLARDYERLGRHDAAQAEREKHAALLRTGESVR